MGCNFSSSSAGKVSPSDDDAINKHHFDVERVIGQGGFAKVNAVVRNKGHDKGTWYAMKTLQKTVILERNHVAMVMKERNLLARLHCPQLVNMHYAFQDDRNLFIVMDVCLGGDLHYQLTHSPLRCFSEDQARFYAAGIILGLEYMHGVGVMHRDIKPENLLLDRRGQLKITDLGISMELVDGICTSTSGTRPYMAPEIFMTGHKHGCVADFYSLGITVYQFLLGQRPYKPDTANMKTIVRMATFVPPEKYTDIKQIRKILMAAQERKAPSPEFKYGQRLAKFTTEAREFIQACLICNPKYRLGSQGIWELMSHPWFTGINWDAMRAQQIAAPFVPDTRQANCSISDADAAAILLNEEENESKAPPIMPADQMKFSGFDYRTKVKDSVSGRQERIIRSSSANSGQSYYYGERDRAQTVTVTNTTEMLQSVGNYGSSRFIFGSADKIPAAVSGAAAGAGFSFAVTPTSQTSLKPRGVGDIPPGYYSSQRVLAADVTSQPAYSPGSAPGGDERRPGGAVPGIVYPAFVMDEDGSPAAPTNESSPPAPASLASPGNDGSALPPSMLASQAGRWLASATSNPSASLSQRRPAGLSPMRGPDEVPEDALTRGQDYSHLSARPNLDYRAVDQPSASMRRLPGTDTPGRRMQGPESASARRLASPERR